MGRDMGSIMVQIVGRPREREPMNTRCRRGGRNMSIVENNTGDTPRRQWLRVMLTLGLLGWVAVGQATAQLPNDATHATIGQHGNVTVLTVPSPVAPGGVGIDFVHAQAMKLPSIARRSDAEVQRDLIDTFTSQVWLGEPGYAAGEI